MLATLLSVIRVSPLFIKKRGKKQEDQYYSYEQEYESSSMWAELEKKLKKLLGLC